MDEKVTLQLQKTRESAKDLKSRSEFSGARKLYAEAILKEKDRQKLFHDYLQFCVCWMMEDPLNLKFFTPFVEKIWNLEVNLKDEEERYRCLSGDFFVERLILFSSACAHLCPKRASPGFTDEKNIDARGFAGEKNVEAAFSKEETTRHEIDCYLQKIFELFIQMLGFCQFHWTICQAFVPLTRNIMTFLDNLSSPASITHLKIRCLMNIGSFWFELGDFTQSEESFGEAIKILNAQFGKDVMEQPLSKLYEKYAYFSQAIKLQGNQNMSQKFLKNLGSKDKMKIKSLQKRVGTPVSHSQQIVKLKIMEGEFLKLLQKEKYSKAFEVAVKTGKEKGSNILSFQSALMQSQCELLESGTFGKSFDEFLVLIKGFKLTAKLVLSLADERGRIKQIIQSVILLQAAIGLDPKNLVVTEMSTAQLLRICENSPNEMVGLIGKLAAVWAPETFEMARLHKGQLKEHLPFIGPIYHDLSKICFISQNHEKLDKFSKEGIELCSEEDEIRKSLLYSGLLYYRAHVLSESRQYRDALEAVNMAKESIQNSQENLDSKKILQKEIDILQQKLEQIRRKIKRSMSQSTVADLSGFQIRNISTSIESMPQLFMDQGYGSDRERTSGSISAAPLGSGNVATVSTSSGSQGSLENMDELVASAKKYHSITTEEVIPAMYKTMDEISTRDGNIATEVIKSCLQKIGRVYMLVGNYEEALCVAKKGLSENQLYGITSVDLLMLAGDASSHLGDFKQAESFYFQAHAHNKRIGSVGETNTQQMKILQKMNEVLAQKCRAKYRGELFRVSKLIGPEGGNIETCEGTICFPEGGSSGVQEDSRFDFHLKSWIFVDEDRGKLCNRIYVDSKEKEEEVKEFMKSHDYRPSCFPVELVVAKNDVIVVGLEVVDGQGQDYTLRPPSQQVEISEDVIQKSEVDPNELDFIVVEYTGKKIILNHTLRQMRAQRLVCKKPKEVILYSTSQGGFQAYGDVFVEHLGS